MSEPTGRLREALETALREAAAEVFADPIMKAANWPETKERMGISQLFVIAALPRVEAALTAQGREENKCATAPSATNSVAQPATGTISDTGTNPADTPPAKNALTLKQILAVLYHGRTMTNFQHVPSVTRAIDWLSLDFRAALEKAE